MNRVLPATAGAVHGSKPTRRGKLQRCFVSCCMVLTLLIAGLVALGEAGVSLWILIVTADYGRLIGNLFTSIVIGSLAIAGLSFTMVILGVFVACIQSKQSISFYIVLVLAAVASNAIILAYIVSSRDNFIRYVVTTSNDPRQEELPLLEMMFQCNQETLEETASMGSGSLCSQRVESWLSLIIWILIGLSGGQILSWICVLLASVLKAKHLYNLSEYWSPQQDSEDMIELIHETDSSSVKNSPRDNCNVQSTASPQPSAPCPPTAPPQPVSIPSLPRPPPTAPSPPTEPPTIPDNNTIVCPHCHSNFRSV